MAGHVSDVVVTWIRAGRCCSFKGARRQSFQGRSIHESRRGPTVNQGMGRTYTFRQAAFRTGTPHKDQTPGRVSTYPPSYKSSDCQGSASPAREPRNLVQLLRLPRKNPKTTRDLASRSFLPPSTSHVKGPGKGYDVAKGATYPKTTPSHVIGISQNKPLLLDTAQRRACLSTTGQFSQLHSPTLGYQAGVCLLREMQVKCFACNTHIFQLNVATVHGYSRQSSNNAGKQVKQ